MRGRILWHAALFTATSVVQGQSSTQSVPTIRTSTEVVLVPIVATRSDGSKVKDLRPSELRLFDNGKSQTVLSFERMGVTSATSNVTSGPSQLAISPVADQYPHFSSFFSMLSTQHGATKYTRDERWSTFLITRRPENELRSLL